MALIAFLPILPHRLPEPGGKGVTGILFNAKYSKVSYSLLVQYLAVDICVSYQLPSTLKRSFTDKDGDKHWSMNIIMSLGLILLLFI